MDNLLSYCGLVDTRISASEKDLPVSSSTSFKNYVVLMCMRVIRFESYELVRGKKD